LYDAEELIQLLTCRSHAILSSNLLHDSKLYVYYKNGEREEGRKEGGKGIKKYLKEERAKQVNENKEDKCEIDRATNIFDA